MTETRALSPSMEDYLEAILKLETTLGEARVKDIAEELTVQMPSVTGALKALRTRKLVSYEKNSHIRLTGQGRKIALSVQKRHTELARFLKEVLLLNDEQSQKAACGIEHVIAPETSLRFRNLTGFLTENIIGKGVTEEEWEKLITEE